MNLDNELITGGLALFNVVVISFFLTGTPIVWAVFFGIIVFIFWCIIGLK